ncbi:MAG TPA: ROK family protein [Acidimicrobiia bacterium]
MRRHNLAAVLDRLHIGGAMSRSHLAGQTGLNRSTIRDLISELTDLGLVAEQPGTVKGRGRPSLVARPRPAGAVVLAVELEVDSMTVATIGLGGHIFERTRIAQAPPRSPEDIVDDLDRLGTPMFDSLPADHTVAGVGVAVAGVVRRQDGFVHVAPNLGWENVPLGQMFSERMGIDRVMMANEADLGALAEFRRGAAIGSQHLIYLAGEVGVGIGVVTNGKPMLGAAGYAGEAGHTRINPSGRLCRCGATGCWETEVGEEALARLVGISDPEMRADLIGEVTRRAHRGDADTFAALKEIGHWLGVGIGNLVNTFNPDLVLIGGFFNELYPFLEESMKSTANEVSLSAPWDACTIRPSKLGIDAHLIGASELVFAEVIANPSKSRDVSGTNLAVSGIPVSAASQSAV